VIQAFNLTKMASQTPTTDNCYRDQNSLSMHEEENHCGRDTLLKTGTSNSSENPRAAKLAALKAQLEALKQKSGQMQDRLKESEAKRKEMEQRKADTFARMEQAKADLEYAKQQAEQREWNRKNLYLICATRPEGHVGRWCSKHGTGCPDIYTCELWGQ
jgi:hypothetical protein